MIDIQRYTSKFNDSIAHLKHEISSLRTGRATPSLIESIPVDVYDSKMQLQQLATITSSDARTLVIQPWDKSTIHEIEKALSQSDLNASPVVDGALIRLPLPPLTEENRRALVKHLHASAEQCRVSLRQHREKVRGELDAAMDKKEISEDQKFKLYKQIDELVTQYTKTIKDISEQKESEIMSM